MEKGKSENWVADVAGAHECDWMLARVIDCEQTSIAFVAPRYESLVSALADAQTYARNFATDCEQLSGHDFADDEWYVLFECVKGALDAETLSLAQDFLHEKTQQVVMREMENAIAEAVLYDGCLPVEHDVLLHALSVERNVELLDKLAFEAARLQRKSLVDAHKAMFEKAEKKHIAELKAKRKK